MDLDGFKRVNDELGHAAGDVLLIEVSRMFRSAIRPSDTVARLGGDEFIILLDPISDIFGAETVAQRIIDSLSNPIPLDQQPVRVSASIGIVPDAKKYSDADAIIRDADQAMYRVKMGGKAGYAFFQGSVQD